MGKLINSLKIGEQPSSNIARHLLSQEFQYEEFVCGHQMGYQKGFPVDEIYCTYIHVDLKDKMLNIYKEYDCGGEVSSWRTDIPEYLIEDDDVEKFMDWLDQECEFYL